VAKTVTLMKLGLLQRLSHRAISAALHSPIGGPRCHRAQHSIPSPLIPPKKASTSQIQIWSTRNQWSWGPFERKVLRPIDYSYFRPLWKQGIYTLQLLFEAPLQAKQPTYTLQLPLDSFQSKVLYALQLLLGVPLKV